MASVSHMALEMITTAKASWITGASTFTGSNPYTYTGIAIGTPTPNRVVTVAVEARYTGAGAGLVSATIGGVAATININVRNSTSSNTTNMTFISAVVPTGTTANIVLTFTSVSSHNIEVYTISNTSSVVASAVASNVVNGSPQLTTINVPANGCLITAGSNGGGTAQASSMTGVTMDDNTLSLTSGHANFISAQTSLSTGITWAGGLTDPAVIAIAFGM